MRIRKKLIICTIILVLISIGMVFPFFWLIRSAFMTNREIMTLPIQWLPKRFSFDNFRGALNAAPFGIYFRNTILITVVNVVGTVLSSSFIAFGFARLRFPGRDFWFAALLTTLMIPFAVVMIPQFIGWKMIGGYNTFAPLMIPAWFGHAFNVFLIRQFFMGIPLDYDEAALVDGANYFTIYWRISLPMAKSALYSVGVFAFMSNWNDFMAPLLYLDKPYLKTITLGLQAFVGQYITQMNYMMAASSLAIVPMIIVYFFAQRYFIEGITFSGLKG